MPFCKGASSKEEIPYFYGVFGPLGKAWKRDRLQPLASRLLEPVLLEGANAAKELVVGLAVLPCRVLDGGKLDGAKVVG